MGFVAPNAELKTNHPHDTSSTVGLSEDYDFIVIGGGTAGLTVASRLTEDLKVRALVVEAGANRLDDPKILTPGLAASLSNDPKYDWNFQTVPQKELHGRSIGHPRGKVLGGSSGIFRMKMVFNSKSASDVWEKMGNHGWNWDTMLPYLRRFHTQAPTPEAFKEIAALAHEDEGVVKGELEQGLRLMN